MARDRTDPPTAQPTAQPTFGGGEPSTGTAMDSATTSAVAVAVILVVVVVLATALIFIRKSSVLAVVDSSAGFVEGALENAGGGANQWEEPEWCDEFASPTNV